MGCLQLHNYKSQLSENFHKIKIPVRRFGRTEIDMPILSLGGMRFQQSCKDQRLEDINNSEQTMLENIISKATDYGLNHIETARHYGTSELQLGLAMRKILNKKRILQTKIPPNSDPYQFETELETSFEKLQCNKIDLLSIHGINLPEHLQMTIRSGGCFDILRKWKRAGKIGFIGFSTHGKLDLILKTIRTNLFDYINLHWYFIKQDNEPALEAAKKYDLGIFIISPTDKGGHLHTPSKKMLDLCSPLHPIIFNDLFCLRDKRVHTLSVGASNPKDLDLHLEAMTLIDDDLNIISKIERRLIDEAYFTLGQKWMETWTQGLPNWDQTPGKINIPLLLWLYNLVQAWGLESFAKDRYELLGRGGHWLPGSNADCLDNEISEESLKEVLKFSPWNNQIPGILRNLKERFGGDRRDRLWEI